MEQALGLAPGSPITINDVPNTTTKVFFATTGPNFPDGSPRPGNLNATNNGLLPASDGVIRYVAEQGIEMGQPGRVYAHVTGGPDAPRAHIGGHAVTVLRGDLLLPD